MIGAWCVYRNGRVPGAVCVKSYSFINVSTHQIVFCAALPVHISPASSREASQLANVMLTASVAV